MNGSMIPTICVIDDNAEVCDIVRIALETRDFRVVSALDGEEGLERIQTTRPDLVILDVKLPGLNGYEVLNRMRQDPQVAATPVIVMTSLTNGSPVSDQEWRDKIEVSDFVSKPFEPLDLVERVEAILHGGAKSTETL